VSADPPRVYVPNLQSNDVYVIDPATLKVVDKFRVGINPQHIVPSWDLRTLWVTNNAEGRTDGSLTPIDPKTGKPGKAIAVDDPYNMYFSPDGKSAIVVAEAMKRLDFRDPKTMALQYSIDVPRCAGHQSRRFLDRRQVRDLHVRVRRHRREDRSGRSQGAGLHASHSARSADARGQGPDGRDEVICTVWKGMPQDIRASPDGKLFYVADMMADGIHVVDGESLRQVGFIFTGKGTHGLYPSRDGKKLYVANRGSNRIHGPPAGKGSVSVVDFATQKVEATWPVPGGGSPDMGNVSADGKQLWLSGRYDNVVYVFDTSSGAVTRIPVGKEPHGLTVWPQPGRYSLGHTGNMR
jgi:YVTN family beta-propeller protein